MVFGQRYSDTEKKTFVSRVAQKLTNGLSQEEACKDVGISIQSFKRWGGKSPRKRGEHGPKKSKKIVAKTIALDKNNDVFTVTYGNTSDNIESTKEFLKLTGDLAKAKERLTELTKMIEESKSIHNDNEFLREENESLKSDLAKLITGQLTINEYVTKLIEGG